MTAALALEAAKQAAPRIPQRGIPLPADLRVAAEKTLGLGLGFVRLHGSGSLARLVARHGADAGTAGDHIAFARGVPDLASPAGRFALGHELAHVAQQRAAFGRVPSGVPARTLEESADGVGRSLSGLRTPVGRRGRFVPPAQEGTPVQFGVFETVGSGARALHELLAPLTDPVVQVNHLALVSQLMSDLPATAASFVGNLGPRAGRLLLDPIQGASAEGDWARELLDLLWNWRGTGPLWAHLLDGVLAYAAYVGELFIHALELFGVGDLLTFLWSTGGRLRGIRPLTGAQIAASQEVHPPGLIPYWVVRVDHDSIVSRLSALFSGKGTVWSQVFGIGAPEFRAVTTMHMIHVGTVMDEPLAVHELTHVAQYELVGAMYMPQALHAQQTMGHAAYDYDMNPHGSLAAAAAAGATFAEFNREQQAQICEDFYLAKHGLVPRQGGALADLEYFVNDFWGRSLVPGLRQVVPQ